MLLACHPVVLLNLKVAPLIFQGKSPGDEVGKSPYERESGFRIRETFTSGIRNAEILRLLYKSLLHAILLDVFNFNCNNILYGAFEMTYYIVIFCNYSEISRFNSQFSEYEDYLKCQV